MSSLFLLSVNYSCKRNGNDSDSTIYVQQEYYFPEELKYTNPGGDFEYEKFYPIGWSKYGHFAYFSEPAEEGLGEYMLNITIINLVNNETEWTWKTEPVEENYREEIWKNNYDLFKEKLNKYEIIQSKDNLNNNAFFSFDGAEYRIQLETTTEVNKDYGFDVIVGTKIILNSSKLGEKIIYNHKEVDYSLVLGQIIAGHIISPFENRVLILLKSERVGYEGTPSLLYYTIIGTNLNTGFQN